MSDEPAGRGRIGVEIFEQVEKIVAAEGITRSEAFQRLSDQTGRRAGTVAANYYRVARQRGTVRPRAASGSRRGRPRRGGGDSGDVDAALSRVSEAIDDLVAVVKRQQRDLSRLQEQSQQLAKLRKLLS
ncbi:MAG: hypothetical protein IT200_01740 [Thermoleophilia bacterium]|nr:hypothetical protein [Thermoleophilia bacterium]